MSVLQAVTLARRPTIPASPELGPEGLAGERHAQVLFRCSARRDAARESAPLPALTGDSSRSNLGCNLHRHFECGPGGGNKRSVAAGQSIQVQMLASCSSSSG